MNLHCNPVDCRIARQFVQCQIVGDIVAADTRMPLGDSHAYALAIVPEPVGQAA